MQTKGYILIISVLAISLVTVLSVEAKEVIGPEWVDKLTQWWEQGLISDDEYSNAIEYLQDRGIVEVTHTPEAPPEEPEALPEDPEELPEEPQALPLDCTGSARCFTGFVTQIIDGDTIKVDGQSIRFALVNTAEYGQSGFEQARKFLESVCPEGSPVLVDEDDGQTQGSYGRILAVVYCKEMGLNLNQAILDAGLSEISTNFCPLSEFSSTAWAQKHGCEAETPPSQIKQYCNPSYPTVCIPPPPPDLDCGDIEYRNFTVLPPDPHGFDGDEDGIGCES